MIQLLIAIITVIIVLIGHIIYGLGCALGRVAQLNGHVKMRAGGVLTTIGGGPEGGAERPRPLKIEADADEDTSNDMQALLDNLSVRMKEPLKTEFKRLFIERYNAPPQPPIVTLDDIPHALPYQAGTKVYRTSTHVGQRKLFNSELEFFTDHLPEGETAVCVYAGAAPSNHTGFLAALFPNVKFILVDPNPFEVFDAHPVTLHGPVDGITPPLTQELADDLIVRAVHPPDGAEGGGEGASIYLINDLFTMELARACHKHIPHEQMLFISDIRTNVATGQAEPDAIDILWNLTQQYVWMKAMQPRMSMLKFRHPFYEEDPAVFASKHGEQPYKADFDMAKELGIDFVANFASRRLVYWDGAVNIQTFPGVASTETRLVTAGTTLRDWGTQTDYENKLFYYNLIERSYCRHVNENASHNDGFDLCNDCALENLLWTRYIEAYPAAARAVLGDDGSVIDLVRRLSINTNRPLIREDHGRFFKDRYPLSKLVALTRARAKNPDTKQTLFEPVRHRGTTSRRPH